MQWAAAAVASSVLAVACGFQVEAVDPGSRDAAPVDGSLDAADVPPDAAMVSPCVLTAMAPGPLLAGVGGSGGSAQSTLVCAAGELPIGLAFDVTPGPISNHANQLLMVHVRVRCGHVARLASGMVVTTPTTVVMHAGGNGSTPSSCDSYFPTTPTAEIVCPAGHVLVGVAGNQVDSTLYNSVAIRCAEVDAAGAVTTTTQDLGIAGTGAYTNQPETAMCPAGEGVVSLFARSGCGQDRLAPSCAALACL